ARRVSYHAVPASANWNATPSTVAARARAAALPAAESTIRPYCARSGRFGDRPGSDAEADHGRHHAQPGGPEPRDRVLPRTVPDQTRCARSDRSTELMRREHPAEDDGTVGAEQFAA